MYAMAVVKPVVAPMILSCMFYALAQLDHGHDEAMVMFWNLYFVQSASNYLHINSFGPEMQ